MTMDVDDDRKERNLYLELEAVENLMDWHLVFADHRSHYHP